MRESPYDTKEEELASLVKHAMRKPRDLWDEDDIDMLVSRAERLADEILED
jgi:hypothetical protein